MFRLILKGHKLKPKWLITITAVSTGSRGRCSRAIGSAPSAARRSPSFLLSRIRPERVLFFAAIAIARGETLSAEAAAKRFLGKGRALKNPVETRDFCVLQSACIMKAYERRFDIFWNLGRGLALLYRQRRDNRFLQQHLARDGAHSYRLLELLRLPW